MKSKLTKNDKWMIIISIAIIVLIILIIILASKADKKRDGKVTDDGYTIKDEVVELPGTNIITNDGLNATKCVDDICISEVKIYSAEGIGRVECNVTNNTSIVKDGHLEMTLGENKILITYKSVAPGETRTIEAEYGGGTIGNVEDYSIRVLTPAEEKEIIR